jgi:hypothetical protein
LYSSCSPKIITPRSTPHNDDEYLNRILTDAIQTLESGDSQERGMALAIIYGNYCTCKNNPKCLIDIEKLYRLFLKHKDGNRYFISNRMDCLDKVQHEQLKLYLAHSLNYKDKYFYELVGKYQIRKFELGIRAKVRKDYFQLLQEQLKSKDDFFNFRGYDRLMFQTKVHVALANLGDTLIEKRLLSILAAHYQTFNIVNPDIENVFLQDRFGRYVIVEMIGKLYSIESVKTTAYMLNNFQNYGHHVYYNDVIFKSVNQRYITEVLYPKLHPKHSYSLITELEKFTPLLYNEYSEAITNRMKLDAEEFMQQLQEKILNDEVEWSSIYDFRINPRE